MSNDLIEILLPALQMIVNALLVVLCLRLIAQACQVNPYNPYVAVLIRVSDAVAGPWRAILPRTRRFDLATFAAMLTVQLLYIVFILYLLGALSGFNFPVAVMWASLGIAGLTIDLLFICIIGMIIVSFVAPHSTHPGVELLWQITEPVMAPVRQILPPMGGLDFSPIVVFIAINIISNSLTKIAVAVSYPGWVIGL